MLKLVALSAVVRAAAARSCGRRRSLRVRGARGSRWCRAQRRPPASPAAGIATLLSVASAPRARDSRDARRGVASSVSLPRALRDRHRSLPPSIDGRHGADGRRGAAGAHGDDQRARAHPPPFASPPPAALPFLQAVAAAAGKWDVAAPETAARLQRLSDAAGAQRDVAARRRLQLGATRSATATATATSTRSGTATGSATVTATGSTSSTGSPTPSPSSSPLPEYNLTLNTITDGTVGPNGYAYYSVSWPPLLSQRVVTFCGVHLPHADRPAHLQPRPDPPNLTPPPPPPLPLSRRCTCP